MYLFQANQEEIKPFLSKRKKTLSPSKNNIEEHELFFILFLCRCVCWTTFFFLVDNSVCWTTSLKKDSQLKILFCLIHMESY